MMDVALFVNAWLKFFFILTPFFGLSVFITMTREMTPAERRKLAIQVTGAVIVASGVLYFFGDVIFKIFGITIDSFRIGGGCLLFLSAVELVRRPAGGGSSQIGEGDIAVVPLALPVIVGPGTTATILVMGAEMQGPKEFAIGFVALSLAGLAVGLLLLMATHAERIAGQRGLHIMSKLTGLILSAIAAEMVFTGIKHFLH